MISIKFADFLLRLMLIGKSKLVKYKQKKLKIVDIEDKSNKNYAVEENNSEQEQFDFNSLIALSLQRTNHDFPAVKSVATMDSIEVMDSVETMDDNVKNPFILSGTIIPRVQLGYYASQGFIGYQICTILEQHWLIGKACIMGARDAMRKGYEVTANTIDKAQSKDILEAIRKGDKKYQLKRHLVEFCNKTRVFGIRILLYKVNSDDPKYYEKPFNIDGIKSGSYQGIVQIDPYWITPELDNNASADPASLYFYEPTWWRVNAVRIHRTHLIVGRYSEISDILKPTYFFGGIPLTQQLYNRVYASERIADEAPELALTKRLNVVYTDIAKAVANEAKFTQRLQKMAQMRTNYGVHVLDSEEKTEQLDTSLTDLDDVIMTEFQLVASIAKVPVTKLLGTVLKGFQATGEYEENNYHEELESIQSDEMQPVIERHHLLLIKSEIAPQFNMQPFDTDIHWRPLDSTTVKGKAENNLLKSQAAVNAINSGAISQDEERRRLATDQDSPWFGLIDEDTEITPEENTYNEQDYPELTSEIENQNNEPETEEYA